MNDGICCDNKNTSVFIEELHTLHSSSCPLKTRGLHSFRSSPFKINIVQLSREDDDETTNVLTTVLLLCQNEGEDAFLMEARLENMMSINMSDEHRDYKIQWTTGTVTSVQQYQRSFVERVIVVVDVWMDAPTRDRGTTYDEGRKGDIQSMTLHDSDVQWHFVHWTRPVSIRRFWTFPHAVRDLVL